MFLQSHFYFDMKQSQVTRTCQISLAFVTFPMLRIFVTLYVSPGTNSKILKTN